MVCMCSFSGWKRISEVWQGGFSSRNVPVDLGSVVSLVHIEFSL